MTTDQFINFLIMPVGGLIFGFIALYATRNKRGKDEMRPGK